ncbi:MAG TPA: hypothetical protein VKP30_12915 [Polyangiaceae bacterium]|nr:hypothetical protein [Polyangiaceae bacterium]
MASGGLRIGSTGIEVLYDGTLGSSFSSWGTTLELALDSTNMQTAFQATGHATETGRCGARIRNAESAVRSLGVAHGVNFRCRMPSVPSSVTLSPLSNTTPVPTVTAESVTVDGFVFSMSADVAAASNAYWYGTYILTA